MTRFKPKPYLDFDMQWVGEHYKPKRRLKCCKDGEGVGISFTTIIIFGLMAIMNAKWQRT
jgi:hypothetical protein